MDRQRSPSYQREQAIKRDIIFCLIAIAIGLFLLLLPSLSRAEPHAVTIEANWTWNGTDETVEGFRFYLDGAPVHDVAGADLRDDVWDVEMENGKHNFELTAYGTKDGEAWETDKSLPFVFEYMYVPSDGRPAPTVYIRIN